LMIPNVGLAGDADADGDLHLADFAVFQRCFGDGGGGALETGCLVADSDRDGDVEAADYAAFAAAQTGAGPPFAGPIDACCLPDGACEGSVAMLDCTWYSNGV
jgi:hypothetical protein